MKASHEEVKTAVLNIGKSLDLLFVTELWLHNIGIHSTIKELTFIMFTQNKQQYFVNDDKLFNDISLVREYCLEMVQKGEVKFES